MKATGFCTTVRSVAAKKCLCLVLEKSKVRLIHTLDNYAFDHGLILLLGFSKTFWKIESANAIFWMYLGGTAKKNFF